MIDARLTLPYPPSVNHYWRCARGRFYVSPEGIRYRQSVILEVRRLELPVYRGRLVVDITLYPPDRRRRDLDNALKSTLDSLQHAGLYEDDSQIDELHIVRAEMVKGGKLEIAISEL